MLRLALNAILLAAACLCVYSRCAEASIIAGPQSITAWESGESDVKGGVLRSGTSESDETRVPVAPGSSELARLSFPVGASPSTGTSAPSSSSSPVSSALLIAGFHVLRCEPSARLAIKESLVLPGPVPRGLRRPPRLECLAVDWTSFNL